MTKLKNEPQLVKKALEVAERYAQNRGFKTFTSTTTANEKIECCYRLLVNDKLVTALSHDQETVPNMKHKLALWIARQLPKDHALLK
jgi:hypothetical protein